VLIVEDSPTQAERVRLLLESAGYEVELARNGRAGLQRVQAAPPDLIISDVTMPEMDGYTFCHAVRSTAATQRIPFVLLTERNTPADILLGLEYGADNFITKPFEDDYLLERVRRIIEHLELRQQDHPEAEISVRLGGRTVAISPDKQQIVELLLATFAELHAAHEQVAHANTELRQLTAALEDRVAQRTAELRAANRQLQCELEERQRMADALRRKDEELHTISQQLWQAAKLATMGELAASLAHELNNPLATISLRVESLLVHTPADDPKQHALAVIEQEAQRMGYLVANLLQFSRRNQPQITSVDVREELEQTLELIQYHLRNHRITVVRQFTPEVLLVHADRQQLRQVFLNLLTNANDAMPQGGTLTLRVAAGTTPTGRPVVRVEVSDTGCGIAPEHLPQVMEPFFTTKAEGKGTGLGLPICRRIVQEHHGTLELTSVVGQGTTVHLVLSLTNKTNSAYIRGPESEVAGA
jgi:signal transduction histidine kinase